MSGDPAGQFPRVDVLGIGVTAIGMDEAVDVIDRWITGGFYRYVCIAGVHGVMESQRDDVLRRIHNEAGMVVPAGMPLVLLARWRGFRKTTRVCGPELMVEFCERSLAAGYRHFFLGGLAGVPERLARRLEKRFPGLIVAGTFSPHCYPMSDAEKEEIVRRINAAKTDIVWVGMATPEQQFWMAEHVGRLNASVLIGVGATFGFHAGRRRQEPRSMQRKWLPWRFRLANEPRRLWRRYLVDNPRFIWLTFMHMWRSRARARGADGARSITNG